jgi:hypothetical protein
MLSDLLFIRSSDLPISKAGAGKDYLRLPVVIRLIMSNNHRNESYK